MAARRMCLALVAVAASLEAGCGGSSEPVGAVPRAGQLFVGYGAFEPTRKAIELNWKQSKWQLWIDGKRVDLTAFGTSDRTLFAFPAAGGKDVILREWRVILVNVNPGEHTIRYRKEQASQRTTDATWTFTVAAN